MAPYGLTLLGPSATDASEVEVDYDKNSTRLYEAITASDWDSAIRVATESPKEAETWVLRRYEDSNEIMWRFLPLHSACARQPPCNVISTLLEAYPDAVRRVDDQGMYPLHYACGNQASREVIRQLLVAYPQAAKLTDPRGMLPIHYLACWGPSSVSIIDMVLVANRGVSDAKDSDGNTPLQLAEDGEYPERDQVVAALRRWVSSSSSAASSSASRHNDVPPFMESDDEAEVYSTAIVSKSGTFSSQYGTTKNSYDNQFSGFDSYSPYNRSSSRALTVSSQPRSSSYNHPDNSASTNSLTINRLRQEISDLKIDFKKKEAETDSQKNKQLGTIKAQCYDLEKQVSSANSNLREAELRIQDLEQMLATRDRDLREKEHKLLELSHTQIDMENDFNLRLQDYELKVENLERELNEKDHKLDDASIRQGEMETECNDLRQTLFDVTDERDVYQRKNENVTARLGSLAASLDSMVEGQDEMARGLQEKDARMAECSALRRSKLQLLVKMEDEILSEILENGAGENAASNALSRQSKEIGAIQAVIATLRA